MRLLGRANDLVQLPWVDHHSRAWKTWADAEEAITGRPSLTARAMAPLLG